MLNVMYNASNLNNFYFILINNNNKKNVHTQFNNF